MKAINCTLGVMAIYGCILIQGLAAAEDDGSEFYWPEPTKPYTETDPFIPPVKSDEESEAPIPEDKSLDEEAMGESYLDGGGSLDNIDEGLDSPALRTSDFGEPLEEHSLEEQPLQEDPLQEEPLEHNPLQELPLQEDSLQENPIKETPLQEEPLQEDPLQEDSLQEAPLQELPLQERPLAVGFFQKKNR